MLRWPGSWCTDVIACRQNGHMTAFGMAHTAWAHSTHMSWPQLVCTVTGASMHCAHTDPRTSDTQQLLSKRHIGLQL